MAIAVGAGIAGAVGTAAAQVSLFGLAVGFQSIAAGFALGAGLSMISRALIPKPSLGQQLAGLEFSVREPDATRKMIYGRTKAGGSIVYIDTTDGEEDNEYIHMVIAFAGHEVDAFEEIYANQERIWNNGVRKVSWQPYLDVNVHLGDQTTADSELVSRSTQWTTDHKLLDTAYIYIRLKYDAEFFANGLPNISATIRGKKVYDPRKDSTSSVYDSTLGVSTQRLATPSTWQFSQNPALCIYDYLRDTKYGLAESASDINSTALATAISLCDQDVPLEAGGNQARYTLDGVIDSANSKKENIEAMLSGMAGKLVYSSGEYFISGGAYVAPSVTIDESVMVGGIEVQTKQSRRGLYNGVKGVFRSEEDDYNVADYPAQLSSTFSTADGDPIYLDMPLPFTTNNIRAQRIAKLALLQSRQQTTVTVPCNLTALKFRAGDTVMITNAKMGWSQKVFQVIGYDLSLSSSGEIVVNVQAIETAAAIYNWASSDEEDYLAGGELALYDGKTAQPPVAPLNITPSSTVNSDGTVTPSLDLSWTAAADAFTDYYIVQYNNSTDSGAVFNQITKTTKFSISPVVPAKAYAVSVFAVNGLGVKSVALAGSATAIADTTPKLPSLYQAVTDSSSAPTAAQFNTAAGRSPKNGDVFLATDTTTATATVHPWTYSTTSASWNENTNFISGNLIVDGSITGDQITANSIQVNKLTGDVSELFPFALEFVSPVGAITKNTTTTYQEFYIPAPDLAISKRNKVNLDIDIEYANSTSSNYEVRAQLGLQVLSKTVATISLGSLTAVSFPGSFRQLIYVSGNVLDKCSNSGGFSNNTTGSAPYLVGTPASIWYDATTDRTYIVLSNNQVLTTGNTLYFNQYRFASAGTWLAANLTHDFSNYSSANTTGYKRFSISESFGQSVSATGIRIFSYGSFETDNVACRILKAEGTMENVS